MSGISTPQYRALLRVRTSNDQDRGFTPPSGPISTPYKRLAAAGLLERRSKPEPPYFCYWITQAGRETLARVQGWGVTP